LTEGKFPVRTGVSGAAGAATLRLSGAAKALGPERAAVRKRGADAWNAIESSTRDGDGVLTTSLLETACLGATCVRLIGTVEAGLVEVSCVRRLLSPSKFDW
jgi:hypothetical protein